jgi:Domain of unknown function (DUF4129)
MTQGRSRTGGQSGGAHGIGQRARLAMTALLVVLVAVGLRGTQPSLGLDGPYSGDQLPVDAGLEAVVLVLLVVAILRHARAPRDNSLAGRLGQVLRGILGAAALALPVVYLATRNIHAHYRPPRPPAPTPGGRPKPLKPYQLPQVSPHAAGSVAGTIVDAVLAAVLLAAIVGCVLLLIRARRPRAAGWPAEPAQFTDDAGEAKLREAVEYGWLALRELDDARGAIIACYLAMEQSLARAGAPRGIAETPDELLARAAGAGIVRGSAAARLTSVFYEARFSTRELTATHRDVAERALAELAASLAERAGAGADGPPP